MRINKFIFLFVGVILIGTACASQTGTNYYTTFNNHLDFSNGVNQTYQLKFILDDIGGFVNTPSFADIDDDGTKEIVFPDYSGYVYVFNWSGLKNGLAEAKIAQDLGTFMMLNADDSQIVGHDNDGDGYLEMALNAYDFGKLKVLEYDGNTINIIYEEPADRGIYRNSPGWCDVDADGDYDIFVCEESGYCRLYLYNSGNFSLNYTDSADRGTFSYGNSPVCANWSNSNWGNGLVSTDYNGVVYFYQWNSTSNALELEYQSSDHGDIYGAPYIGTLNENLSEVNYVVIPYTNGIAYLYNCSQSGCTNLDSGADMGSFTYGGPEYKNRTINGKVYLFNMDSEGQGVLTYMNGPSSIDSIQVGEDILYIGSCELDLPRINSSTDYEYLLLPGGLYTSSVAFFKKNGDLTWQNDYLYRNIEEDIFSLSVSVTGFLYGSGFMCDDFDGQGDADECIICSYLGFCYIFTYENISEYTNVFYDDYELSLLDIMPRDAIQYKIGNRTYCVNENENVFLHGLGDGNINKWIDAMDDDGSAISNEQRITDGVLSTGTLFYAQTGSDYVTLDSGDEQGMRLNLTKLPQLGEIQFWGYFNDNRDILDFSVEISNTTCTNPDVNSYTSVFDEQEGASDEYISGSNSYLGTKIKFLPQQVGCIRFNMSGSYYSGTTYVNANFVTEVAGYYGNDCTFYSVPVDVRGAVVGENYNHSSTAKKFYEKQSPYQENNNLIGLMGDFTSGIVEVINRWIILRE